MQPLDWATADDIIFDQLPANYPQPEYSNSIFNLVLDSTDSLLVLGGGSYGSAVKYVEASGRELTVKITRSLGLTQSTLIEGAATVRLNHPNISKLLGSGWSGDHQLLVYSFAPKSLLSNLTDELTSDQKYKYSYQLLCAVGYCHSRGIIHRDIKPGNILIDYDDNIKLHDFGLASIYKCIRGSILVDIVGSRWYQAPELLFGTPYNKTVDTWAAACTIYEIFMLKPLLPGANNMTQLAYITGLLGDPPPLYQRAPNYSTWQEYYNSSLRQTITPKSLEGRFGLLLKKDPNYSAIMNVIITMLTYTNINRPSINAILRNPIWYPYRSTAQDYSVYFDCELELDLRALPLSLPLTELNDDVVVSAATAAVQPLSLLLPMMESLPLPPPLPQESLVGAIAWLLAITTEHSYAWSGFHALNIFYEFRFIDDQGSAHLDLAACLWLSSHYHDHGRIASDILVTRLQPFVVGATRRVLDEQARFILQTTGFNLCISICYDYYRQFHNVTITSNLSGVQLLNLLALTELYVALHPRYIAMVIIMIEYQYNKQVNPYHDQLQAINKAITTAHSSFMITLQEMALVNGRYQGFLAPLNISSEMITTLVITLDNNLAYFNREDDPFVNVENEM